MTSFPWDKNDSETPLKFLLGKAYSYGSYEEDYDLKDLEHNVLYDWTPHAEAILREIAWESGFGSVECPAIMVWTTSMVWHITQYDGDTSWYGMPRHPRNCCVHISGGG